jgi:hypothetical protein
MANDLLVPPGCLACLCRRPGGQDIGQQLEKMRIVSSESATAREPVRAATCVDRNCAISCGMNKSPASPLSVCVARACQEAEAGRLTARAGLSSHDQFVVQATRMLAISMQASRLHYGKGLSMQGPLAKPFDPPYPPCYDEPLHRWERTGRYAPNIKSVSR